MGLYSEYLLPRLVHSAMSSKQIVAERPRCAGRAQGRVLEVGLGSGLNLPHYGERVTEVLAIEPARLARKMARERIEAAPFPVSFVDLDGQRVPLEDGSVDCVVSSWTLCTIPDVATALAEMRRVLSTEGELHFIEHGLSPDPKVAKWQRRLNPIQKIVAGGCHLNRPIDVLIREAGFEIEEIEQYGIEGPKPASWLYAGWARR